MLALFRLISHNCRFPFIELLGSRETDAVEAFQMHLDIGEVAHTQIKHADVFVRVLV